ncbi:MAG: hypothetical protein ACLQF0_06700 [Dissulfurispiraceae bacterium]
MNSHRFKVVEYSGGYAVGDTLTGQEHWMSDGVDVLFTLTGKPISPGTENFRRSWEKSLNETADETLEGCFPEQYEKEAALCQ